MSAVVRVTEPRWVPQRTPPHPLWDWELAPLPTFRLLFLLEENGVGQEGSEEKGGAQTRIRELSAHQGMTWAPLTDFKDCQLQRYAPKGHGGC